jgi:hypothetical protein
MLKSILLALLLGDQGLLAARAEALQGLSGTSASREVVESELRVFGLLMEIDLIGSLSAKLGAKLVGSCADDFEDGLARVTDEPLFAELLGRLARLAIEAADVPDLGQQLDAELAPHSDASDVAARLVEDLEPLSFLENLEPLSRWSRAPLQPPHMLAEFTDGVAQMRHAGPEELGAELLQSLYDPAATPMFSDFAWALVRTVGRIVAVRHFEAHGLTPSESYRSSMLKDSRGDVEQLTRTITAVLDPNPAAIIPFVLDAYQARANRHLIDAAMEQLDERPNSWAERFGAPPGDAE